jgi:hypothetical protein
VAITNGGSKNIFTPSLSMKDSNSLRCTEWHAQLKNKCSNVSGSLHAGYKWVTLKFWMVKFQALIYFIKFSIMVWYQIFRRYLVYLELYYLFHSVRSIILFHFSITFLYINYTVYFFYTKCCVWCDALSACTFCAFIGLFIQDKTKMTGYPYYR